MPPMESCEPAEADGLRERLADDRLRLLATLGGGIVHELANRIGTTLGCADELARKLPPELVGTLERGVAAARDSLVLLRSVVRMLEREPEQCEAVELQVSVAEAVQLLRKHAMRSGTGIEVADGFAALRARVPLVDLVQAIVTATIFAQRADSEGLLRFSIEPHSAARPTAAVRIADRGPAMAYEALRAALLAASPDIATALRQAAGGADSLVLIASLLRRYGGDLLVECGPQERSLLLCLPLVRR